MHEFISFFCRKFAQQTFAIILRSEWGAMVSYGKSVKNGWCWLHNTCIDGVKSLLVHCTCVSLAAIYATFSMQWFSMLHDDKDWKRQNECELNKHNAEQLRQAQI